MSATPPNKQDGKPQSSLVDKKVRPARIIFEPSKSYILTAGKIWLEPGKEIGPGWLRIESGRTAGSGPGEPPPQNGTGLIDLDSVLLVPGLIDSHVHLALDPGDGLDLPTRVETASAYGLAAVRDGGDKAAQTLQSRALIQNRFLLAASGQALHAPGRYGGFLGRPAAGRRDMARAVAELAEKGADQIKVIASGPVDLEVYGRVGPPQFEVDDLKYLVSSAREAGLKVMAHANGPEAVQRCLQAGAASIEHGYFMGGRALNLLAETGAAWTPTIQPLAALGAREPDGSARQTLIRRIIQHQLDQLSRAGELGVEVVIGTDAGSPGVQAGAGLIQEMSWWRRAGFRAEDILAAATLRAATLLGWTSLLGSFRPGRLAFAVGLSLEEPPAEAMLKPPLVTARPDLAGGCL